MYLTTFVIAFLISVLATPLTIKLGRRWGIVDRPDERRQHRGEISRLGGLALFVSFVGTGVLIFGLSLAGWWEPIGGQLAAR